jgi:hypothetical protein
MILGHNYIVSMASVNIYTYSKVGNSSAMATLMLTDTNTEVFDQKTKFNMLSYSDLNLTIVSAISSSYVESDDKNILLYKSEFTIDNFYLRSEYSNEATGIKFIDAHLGDYKPVKFNNLDVLISGILFGTYEAAEVHVNNMTYDFYKSLGSIVIITYCNYPGAWIGGGLFMDNVIFFESAPKRYVLNQGAMWYTGSGNATLNNVTCNLFSEFPVQWPIIIVIILPT